MPEQVTILLALTEGLLDPLPVERMEEAQDALCKAAETMPAEVQERLETAKHLSDADRRLIVEAGAQGAADRLPDAAEFVDVAPGRIPRRDNAAG